MIDLRFEVPITPYAKGRPRAKVVLARGQRKRHVPKIYTPPKTARWERSFANLALIHRPGGLIDEPVRVDIFAVLPRPLDRNRKIDPPGFLWAPHSRADRDNVEKIVLDALTVQGRGEYRHDGFWKRDGIACLGETALVYAELGGAPRIRIGLRSIAHIPPEHTAAAMHLCCEWEGCHLLPTDGAFCAEHEQSVLGEHHLVGELEASARAPLRRRIA